MPLENSHFRIIRREKDDPHGVEGYFLHEIYTLADGTVRSWRAGVSIGAPEILRLKDHMVRVIEAFNHEPILYKDLATSGFQLPTVSRIDPPVRYALIEQRRARRLSGPDPS